MRVLTPQDAAAITSPERCVITPAREVSDRVAAAHAPMFVAVENGRSSRSGGCSAASRRRCSASWARSWRRSRPSAGSNCSRSRRTRPALRLDGSRRRRCSPAFSLARLRYQCLAPCVLSLWGRPHPSLVPTALEGQRAVVSASERADRLAPCCRHHHRRG